MTPRDLAAASIGAALITLALAVVVAAVVAGARAWWRWVLEVDEEHVDGPPSPGLG